VRLAVDEHDLAEDELVIAPADGVRAHEHGLQDAVGLVTGGLLRARAVEGPDRRFLAGGDDLGLRTELLCRLSAVDPDVLGSVNAH
jgi:hypothetical protein